MTEFRLITGGQLIPLFTEEDIMVRNSPDYKGGEYKMHQIRKLLWAIFGILLIKFGFGAEATEDKSIFYIVR